MLQLYVNIRDRRMALGMTQEELAHKIGYSGKSMIAKVESGLVDLPQSKILAFASALEIDAGDLMGFDYTTDPPIELTTHEQNLVNNYRQLDPYGRGKVDGYVESLVTEKCEKKRGSEEGVEGLCG